MAVCVRSCRVPRPRPGTPNRIESGFSSTAAERNTTAATLRIHYDDDDDLCEGFDTAAAGRVQKQSDTRRMMGVCRFQMVLGFSANVSNVTRGIYRRCTRVFTPT